MSNEMYFFACNFESFQLGLKKSIALSPKEKSQQQGACIMNLLRHRLLPSSSVLGVLLFTLSAACLGSFAKAQGTTAHIVGKVADQTGAAIPNATIDVQNTGTGLGRTVTSSATGEYVIPSLPGGSYSLKAVATGFKTYNQSGINLEGGQQARLDVSLQIGSTT